MAEQLSILEGLDVDLDRSRSQLSWAEAMANIFYFIRAFVPRPLFDLQKANPEQLRLLTDLQALIDAGYQGTRNFIIKAPRKGGKTILVAIIVVWLALRKPRFRICVVAGSLAQAQWLYRYCSDIVTSHPMINSWVVGDVTRSWTRFKHQSFIVCIPASHKQVNAPTVDVEVFDEYVMIDPDIIIEAWPMNRASETPLRFILSTALNKVSLDSFLDLVDRAEELGFSKYEWTDENCPWLSESEDLLAQAIMDKESYQIHYKGGLPLKSGMVWPRDPIVKAFKKEKDLPADYFDVVKGPVKIGIDWGFTHDTVYLAGWLSLDQVLNIFKIGVFDKTDDEALADVALSWDEEFYERYGQRAEGWYADAAGAFQNAMLRKRGFWVTRRVFGSVRKGKEWMIGIAEWYLKNLKVNIPDTKPFLPLKRQIKAYKRNRRTGKPIKGRDHCVDAFLCLCSGWNPVASLEAPKRRPQPADRIISIDRWKETDWSTMKIADDTWRPAHWKNVKWPWEK